MESVLLQTKAEAPNLDNYFIQRQLEMMIETNNRKLANELTVLHSTIDNLNAEILDIKRRLNESRTARTIPEPEVRVCESDSSNTSIPVQQTTIEANHQQTNANGIERARTTAQAPTPIQPRCGNYKSEDVSIDKFFYFGGKRK